MYHLLLFFAWLSLLCILFSLWKPLLYPFASPTRGKAAVFYGLAAAVLFLLAAVAGTDTPAPSPLPVAQERTSPDAPAVAVPQTLPWRMVSEETVCLPDTERHRLSIVITPKKEPGQEDARLFLATVREAARQIGSECEMPVIVVSLIARETGSPLSQGLLAQAVHIPDGKGLDGTASSASPWESQLVVERNFTPLELEYLNLWAELFKGYLAPTGLQEQELDAAICARLGVAPGSLDPFANALRAVAE